MSEEFQLELFASDKKEPIKAEYKNYDEWIAHFNVNPKTTDECWTPSDVYDAVVRYVTTLIDMEGREIIRPFFPGGDYENTEYPDNCVVIDNPPFSMFKKITQFYSNKKILFFLFGPALTIGNGAGKFAISGAQIRYANGAMVPTEFCTNLPDVPAVFTAPTLGEAIKNCPSQGKKTKTLKSYSFPEELLSVSDLRTIASGGVYFAVEKVQNIRKLDLHKDLFGNHWLISQAQAKAKAQATIPIALSVREQAIVDSLN